MKIIFCLNHFLPEYLAGTEVYTYNLARELKTNGVNAIVLIPNLGKDETDEYYYEGIRVLRYAENSLADRKMILGQTKPGGVVTFTNILKNEQPDIVHFHELAPGRGIHIFHVEAAFLLNIKTVLTCHVANYSCNTGNLKYKDRDTCDGKIKVLKCTACSYHAKNIVGAKANLLSAGASLLYAAAINTLHTDTSWGTALGFPFMIAVKKKNLLRLSAMLSKIVVLTKWYKNILEINGVAAAKIRYVSQGLPGENIKKNLFTPSALPLKLVFIGRISYLKGVHLLLAALQHLPADKISIDIYGPDTEDDYANHCREVSKTMQQVRWMGAIDSGKVMDTLRGYDLLCLPSTFSEMSPLVIQEAFAAGIPVLASDVYGNAEQVTHGVNGWLFEFKNSDSLKQQLQRLIDDPSLIDAAKKNIPAPRNFAAVALEHVELYNALMN